MDSYGNVVSGMFSTLATHLDNPAERLRAISQGTRKAKELFSSGVEDVVMEWAEVPNPVTIALAARLSMWMHLLDRLPPVFNLLISNVPGPPNPLYAAGARLLACYPTGPLIGNIVLNITVLSYSDSIDFGILTCPDVVPDPWTIAEGIDASFEELVQAAGTA